MRTVTLRVLCEGPTEENFVARVLAPHLQQHRVFARWGALHPKGSGSIPFETLRNAIKNEVGRSRDNQFVTTMIDLYGLQDFPGNDKRPGETALARVGRIEAEMAKGLPNPRFIPHIQLHEFEALIFVDLDQLHAAFPGGEARGAAERLSKEVGARAPEEIDEGKESAPSKRLVRAVPAYATRKASVAAAITERIGLVRLRAKCPHFHAWVTRLETLAEAK